MLNFFPALLLLLLQGPMSVDPTVSALLRSFPPADSRLVQSDSLEQQSQRAQLRVLALWAALSEPKKETEEPQISSASSSLPSDQDLPSFDSVSSVRSRDGPASV